MSDRRTLIDAFLGTQGWHRQDARPLADDASFRTYWRLVANGRRAVLMDAPPPHEDVRAFARIARHLAGLGLSAPEVLAEDADAGLLLLEDLGDDTFSRLLAAGEAEAELYALATDVLIHLHRLSEREAIPAETPLYDDGLLLEEACLLADWYVPAVRGEPLDAVARDTYVEAWQSVFPLVHGGARSLVLRDFHVDNLMRLGDRDGVAACGLLDFQDAVSGPLAYDLMSLLEDARRDIPPGLRAAMIDRYLRALPNVDAGEFLTVFMVLAAQRHAKVIGIFTRLCHRDQKPGYLVHIPRVWRLLERALSQPVMHPVRDWFDVYVPKDVRVIPPERSPDQ